MNALALYARYVAISLSAQGRYPASFAMHAVGQFGATIVEFVGMWALFRRFDQINGWQFADVALFYGVIHVSFALADAITRGFDVFGTEFVRTGDFDRLLLRPRATTLQLAGHDFRLASLGRLLQGLVALAIAVSLLDVRWGPVNDLLVASAIVGGVALFVAIMIMQATLAFWTVESLEIANTLTYGGVEAAQYPLDIYAGWFRKFLTFVVPLGCVSYFPLVVVLGRSDGTPQSIWLAAASPAAGIVFLVLSLGVWRYGVHHYTSTGS